MIKFRSQLECVYDSSGITVKLSVNALANHIHTHTIIIDMGWWMNYNPLIDWSIPRKRHWKLPQTPYALFIMMAKYNSIVHIYFIMCQLLIIWAIFTDVMLCRKNSWTIGGMYLNRLTIQCIHMARFIAKPLYITIFS